MKDSQNGLDLAALLRNQRAGAEGEEREYEQGSKPSSVPSSSHSAELVRRGQESWSSVWFPTHGKQFPLL